MPKKATKPTSNKSNSTAKSKSKAANKTNLESRNVSEPQVADYKDLFYGTMSAIAVYVFAIWAIDGGSLWVYALTFASLYYTVHFFRLFIRNKFFYKQ